MCSWKTSGGRLVAAAPTYLKTHSQGEYVFDHTWAEAYQRAGGRYYPKLQVAVPFTPVTGRRLLVARGCARGRRETLIAGLRALREAAGASSIHVTFPDRRRQRSACSAPASCRGRASNFISSTRAIAISTIFSPPLPLASARRSSASVREALGDDITVELLTGSDIKSEHWDAFFVFYMDTGSRKWGRPYLTRDFFDRVGAAMAERVLLVMAKRAGRYIAGAINYLGDDALYGRNWGAIEERPFLHFEICYYQAIEFAIRRGLKRVEAGAQGEHKLARGYRPVPTYSAHEFADPRFQQAVAAYLARERAAVDEALAEYAEQLPFRREG